MNAKQYSVQSSITITGFGLRSSVSSVFHTHSLSCTQSNTCCLLEQGVSREAIHVAFDQVKRVAVRSVKKVVTGRGVACFLERVTGRSWVGHLQNQQ
jgi:hypothetical protein